MRRSILYIFTISVTFNFCNFKKNEKSDLHLYKVNLTIDDLFGTWANSKIKELNSMDTIRSYFRPISGFTIRYDSVSSKYVFEMQYYEQLETYTYDSFLIQNDSIIGIDSGKSFYIGLIDKSEEQISDFQLIDYGVFATQKNDRLRFSKYTDCILKCSIEAFLLDESLNLFPITILYDTKEYTIHSNRKHCGCNGEIIGFDGYSSYQIVEIYKNKVIELALNNIKKREFEFFTLEIRTKNILKKIK